VPENDGSLGGKGALAGKRALCGFNGQRKKFLAQINKKDVK